ncbi:hypothetical protein [Deinococcus hohokamensis]|uniref:Uncharacterized protein n=1 Tax=Deinococcus hohokamensis TaxID=309883 RepID=A0ABV9I852_9DEIO
MNPDLYMGLTFIVATVIHGGPFTAVRRGDSVTGPHTLFTGVVGARINVYDYGRSETISGHLYGATYHLYDVLTQKSLQCTVDEDTFEGVDEGSKTPFFGRVQGLQVTLYDGEFGTSHDFTMVPEGHRRVTRRAVPR